MASLLRSVKFVRYLAGYARNIILTPTKEAESNILQQNCLCSVISNGFATASKQDPNLERSIKRLDQDVRRSGRISRRDIEEVLEEIRQQQSATSSQSLLVIRCCGNLVPEELPEVRTALVKEIWKTLNNLNVPMDISHYNALLRVYLENEHEFSSTEFLSDLAAKGIEPNRVTYQRLISRYCQQGDIEGATKILEFMREKQLPVNENVFNALIMGHSQADDMESAVGILSVMQQASLEPSADTYTTLLCGYARKGDLNSIESLFETCDKKDIYLLDKDLLDIIYALTTNGHGDKVDQILPRLRKSAGFNSDAVNIILRLTSQGYEDVALKILKTMPRGSRPDGELSDTGNFFIKQMVKSERPVEKIITICKVLQEEGLNSKPLLVAIEAGLTNGATAITLPLLKEAINSNLPIKQHYFWPIICTGKSKGNNFILDVISKMQNEFNISPNSETVRDYIIPNLTTKTDTELISLLRSAGISTATASSCGVYYLLNKGKIKEAADLSESYNAYYAPGLFRKPLIQALSNTQDVNSYIRLVRQIYESISRWDLVQNNKKNVSETLDNDVENVGETQNQKEILGQIVYDAVSYFRKHTVENIPEILNGLVKEGLSISASQAERIQELIASELTTEISTLLDKLTSGDLEPKALDKKHTNPSDSLGHMSMAQLENLITSIENKGESAKGIKRFMLASAIKSRDVTQTEQILDRLKTEGYVLTTGVNAQLIDLYVHHEKLDDALSILNSIKQKEPDFILDNIKTVRLASLLIQNNQMDAALKLLDDNKRDIESEKPDDKTNFNFKSTVWRLLNSLAEAGKIEDLNTVFDSLIKNNYIEPNNVLLGPLVKVHLINNNLSEAVNKFEEICQKYQATPWKNELACKLIQAEDATNLQRVTDLSTSIHGEVNSLYDLVFSFVECGRIRQARKILETPGLRNRPQRINSACERYQQEGMVQSLEGLMEATKDLNHIDRSDICYNLLLSYCKEDDTDKALGLWTKLQEEDMTPSEEFLLKLGQFLKSKNIEAPFVVPTQTKPIEPEQRKFQSSGSSKTDTVSTTPYTEKLTTVRQALKRGDINSALTSKSELGSGRMSVIDQSAILEKLVQSGRLNDATKFVVEMLSSNIHPIPRIFRFYLNKLAASGDIKSLEQIDQYLTPQNKKLVSFDNRVCHANIVAGKSEEYLQKLENDIVNAKSEQEITDVAGKFPRGGTIGILDGNPELAERFERMSEKYAEKGIIGPMNVLWVHHFIKGNTEDCNRIWNQHLSTAPRLMFQRIVHMARENKDEELIQRLIDLLKQTKVSEGAMGNAYSCLLDVYAVKEKFDEGLVALDSAVKDVCLEHFNRTALLRIKLGVEKNGKTFPHKIPDKFTKHNEESSESSSSSSSSSDDEKKAKANK